MPTIRNSIWIISIVASAFIFLTVANAQSQRRSEPTQAQPTQQSTVVDQRGTEQSPAFVKIVPTPKTAVEAAQEAKDREEKAQTEEWLVRWTGAVALFTLVLAGVGAWQGIQLKRSVDLARQEFIASHRPILRIRRIILMPPLLPDTRITIAIEVANVGDTIATVDELGVDIYPEGARFDARPQPRPNFPPIPPGGQANIQALSGNAISEAQVDAIETGMLELRGLSIINYRDDNGVLRSTSFARVYNRALHRFIKVDHDHPEADREFED